MAELPDRSHWTDADVRALVDEARAEAWAEAKARLREELVRELLARAATGEARGPVPPTRAPASLTPAAPAEEAPRLVYVYGVVEAGTPLPADEAHLELVEADGLAAVVQRVPAEEFSAAALQRNLEDLEWLRSTSARHEEVLTGLLPGPVAPLRLCSVFTSADNVRAMLGERRTELAAALDRVRGHQELGVKIVVDPEALRRAAAKAPVPAAPAGAGAGYIAERRRQRRADDDARALGRMVADEAHAVLAELAADVRRRPPQDPRLSGTTGWMVLNGAYLVPNARAEGLRRLATELGERYAPLGAVVSVTGPWPPHNFVGGDGRDEDGPRDS